MEVRTNAEVGSIIVRNGRAEGVALRSGDEIAAKVVIANADAKTTFLNLLEPSTLPADFVRHIRNFRAVSTAFKIHLAVDRLPTYPNFDSSALGFDYPAQVRIAPSVEYMERAYDDVRQGRMSRRPYLTVLAPTVVDFNIGAGGRSYPQYLRRPRAAGSAERARGRHPKEALFEIVRETLLEYAPGFDEAILHKQILVPMDFQRIFALPGGHPHHGDISPDQLFFRRPAPHFANYRTPVERLYLCGASTHPGGGVSGVPGHNAARVVLKDWKRRSIR